MNDLATPLPEAITDIAEMIVMDRPSGRKWRIVRTDKEYRRSGEGPTPRLHKTHGDLIQFFDLGTEARPNIPEEGGQFVSSYYSKSLLSNPHPDGLDLHGGVPAWKIGSATLSLALSMARAGMSVTA